MDQRGRDAPPLPFPTRTTAIVRRHLAEAAQRRGVTSSTTRAPNASASPRSTSVKTSACATDAPTFACADTRGEPSAFMTTIRQLPERIFQVTAWVPGPADDAAQNV